MKNTSGFKKPAIDTNICSSYNKYYPPAKRGDFLKALNLPVEMISLCAADGKLYPLRFRYEDDGQRLQTVKVNKVLTAKEINYVGVQGLLFICKAFNGDQEILFELRYTVKTHNWVLFRIIS